jgi:4-hydroxy-tetrahydrodipicolinate synthase
MEIQFELMPLHRNLFVEPNPIPLKWAMSRLGLCGGDTAVAADRTGRNEPTRGRSRPAPCGLLKG